MSIIVCFSFVLAGHESNLVMSQFCAAVKAKPVILVVDDDSAIRDSLKFMMEVEGFEVRTYSNAHEVLSEDSLPAFSCLVVDYHMPAMNGLGLVAVLRDRRISIPAILMTAHPDESMRTRAAAAGIAVVEKPLLGRCLVELHPRSFRLTNEIVVIGFFLRKRRNEWGWAPRMPILLR